MSEKIRCDACPVMCYIAEGQTGACDRYANAGGRIVRTDPVVMLSHAVQRGARLVPFTSAEWDGGMVPEGAFVTGIDRHAPLAPWHARPHRCARRRTRSARPAPACSRPSQPRPAPRVGQGPGVATPETARRHIRFSVHIVPCAPIIAAVPPVQPFPLPMRAPHAYLGGGHNKGRRVLGSITDGLNRGVETTLNTVSEAFMEPVVRLGVTGLSRAGKTVFITGLVANLLDRGRMPQLRAHASGRIQSVFLQPQPDVTLPRFDYEGHLAALTGDNPRWPDSTRAVSELRLSFRVQPDGWLGAFRGPRVLHLDIVDYPGEWLLDLGIWGWGINRCAS